MMTFIKSFAIQKFARIIEKVGEKIIDKIINKSTPTKEPVEKQTTNIDNSNIQIAIINNFYLEPDKNTPTSKSRGYIVFFFF